MYEYATIHAEQKFIKQCSNTFFYTCIGKFPSNNGPTQKLNMVQKALLSIHSLIHSAIYIAPLQVLYYSEALPTTARIPYRSFTPKRNATVGKKTCPRSLHGGQSGSRTHDPPVESYRLNQVATMSHNAAVRINPWQGLQAFSFRHQYIRTRTLIPHEPMNHSIPYFRTTCSKEIFPTTFSSSKIYLYSPKFLMTLFKSHLLPVCNF